jgi:hypothetical protein
VARVLSRRGFILGASAATLMAGCESSPVTRFLRSMQIFKRRVDEFLFSSNRLAPEFAASRITPDRAFPSYFISNDLGH